MLFSDLNSRYRFRAAKFVLGQGYVPTYPKIVGDFFTVENTVPRSRGTDERANLIKKCDQVWVFGQPNASMQTQIELAKNQGKAIKHFMVLNGQFWEKEHRATA